MSARDIIIRPVITEKSMRASSEDNKTTFIVAKNANKVSVAQAIQEIYNVKPEKVNIVNVRGKARRVGRYEGKTNSYKKAIVKFPEGQGIDIFETE